MKKKTVSIILGVLAAVILLVGCTALIASCGRSDPEQGGEVPNTDLFIHSGTDDSNGGVIPDVPRITDSENSGRTEDGGSDSDSGSPTVETSIEETATDKPIPEVNLSDTNVSTTVPLDGEKIPVSEESGNKNAPKYKPSSGGENPFETGTKTEIYDTPVEEYIGDGEDRPGEGIHF